VPKPGNFSGSCHPSRIISPKSIHTHTTHYTRPCQIDRWCGVYYYYLLWFVFRARWRHIFRAHAALRQQFTSILLYFIIILLYLYVPNMTTDRFARSRSRYSNFYGRRSNNHRKQKNRNLCTFCRGCVELKSDVYIHDILCNFDVPKIILSDTLLRILFEVLHFRGIANPRVEPYSGSQLSADCCHNTVFHDGNRIVFPDVLTEYLSRKSYRYTHRLNFKHLIL